MRLLPFGLSEQLCPRRESNPHAFRHQILSLARLPVSPLGPTVSIGGFEPTTALVLNEVPPAFGLHGHNFYYMSMTGFEPVRDFTPK